MKKAYFTYLVLALCVGSPSAAVEFTAGGAPLAVDFPAGWQAAKSDDPAVVLKLEKGRAFFEFARLDSELSDYYLKARVKEQIDSLRGKGTTLSGDVRPAGIRGLGTAYYTSYESMGAQVHIAFFTYGDASYAISARGLDDGELRGVISTIRKPGEKIEPPARPKKARRTAKKSREDEDFGPQIFREEPMPLSSVESILASVPVSSEPAAAVPAELSAVTTGQAPAAAATSGEQALRQTREFLSGLGAAAEKIPYVPRKPLGFGVWALILAAWGVGAYWARGQGRRFENPRLSQPPKDVPPDFFFPFIISRTSTLNDSVYNVLTRQKQLLLAEFSHGHSVYLAGAVYACLLFHVVWSLLELLGRGGLLVNALLSLPGGSLWASAPELFFAVPFIAGVSMYLNKPQVLRLLDAQSNLLMEAVKHGGYGLIRDGKGKDLARLAKKGGFSGRSWDFTDLDNVVQFTVRDDSPRLHLLRKLFGSLGGALRARYGIFVQDRRAGFVFLDPSSPDRFQIHLEFDFARLAHPAQILACVLYIVCREDDPVYPWPL